MKHIILYLLIGITAVGCVPSKKIVYLQHDDELDNRKEVPRDTVLRRHQMNIQEYKIQPLDILLISFESLTNESLDFFSRISEQQNRGGGGGGAGGGAGAGILVDVDGNIEYPVIGKVNVEGLTVFEAEDKLQALVNDYLKDAVVRIRLLNFRFTVLGEVGGESVLTSPNTRITFMEAIAMAGGLTELADRSYVKIIRQKGSVSEVLYVNLLEEDYIESEYFFVQQNDIVIVPPLKQRTFRRYWTQNVGLVTSLISTALFLISLTN